LLSGLMIWGLSNRSPVEAHALRDRNPTFVRLRDGSVRDGYTLKLANRAFDDRDFRVTVSGIPGARVWTPGSRGDAPVYIHAPANEVTALRVFVTAPPAGLNAASQPITFHFVGPRTSVDVQSVFLSGAANVAD
jgi:polyferredoxin